MISHFIMLGIAGVGEALVRALAIVLIVSAGLGTLIALYARLRGRQTELAVLRLLGASRAQLFATVMLEALLLAVLGAILGLALGHGAAAAVRLWLPRGHALGSMSLAWRRSEWIVPLVALSTGLLAAIMPATSVYRTQVALILGRRA